MKAQPFIYHEAGSLHNLKIEVLIDLNRELTDRDREGVLKAIDQIQNSIREESANLSPKNKAESKENKEAILSLFGDNKIFVEEIPNGYCSQYCCKHLPWFIVTTIKGRITIGCRKRVISIDWNDSTIQEDANQLFPNEDVTKEGKLIHAWGYEYAKKYLDILLT